MPHPAPLVLGTHNRKKGRELADLLGPLGFTIRTLEDFDHAIEVVEDGRTFADNARKKAAEQARQLGEWVLGEDSGICVDALDGAPGVYSARYSGENASDTANNLKLLRELANVNEENRGAHYVCWMALANPAGRIRAESDGICRGRIVRAPQGSGGFGYDPLFEIAEYHRTFGELGGAVKQALSHRGRALRRLTGLLVRLQEQGDL